MGWYHLIERYAPRHLEDGRTVTGRPRSRPASRGIMRAKLTTPEMQPERPKERLVALGMPFEDFRATLSCYRPRKRYFETIIPVFLPYSGFLGSLGAKPCRRTEMTHASSPHCSTVWHAWCARCQGPGMPLRAPPTNQPRGPETGPTGDLRPTQTGVQS